MHIFVQNRLLQKQIRFQFYFIFQNKNKNFFLLLFQVSDRRLPEPFKICRKSSQKKAAAAPVARLRRFASSFSFLCHFFFVVAAVLFGPSCRGPAVAGKLSQAKLLLCGIITTRRCTPVKTCTGQGATTFNIPTLSIMTFSITIHKSRPSA